MNSKVLAAIVLVILIIISFFFFTSQGSTSQNDVQKQYAKDLADEKEKVTQVDTKIAVQKKIAEAVVLEEEVAQEVTPNVSIKEKEVPQEVSIPNGFKAATPKEIAEISSKELKLENYTEIYDANSLNVFIDNYLKKNVKQKNIDSMLAKIKRYMQDSTVIIKKDKDFNVYLEIMEYKNEELMNLNDKYVKSNHIYHFGFDESKIKKEENIDLFLGDLDVAIKEGEAKNLVLVGYTDSVGQREYNTFLSYKRAHSLSDKLSKYDVGIKYIIRGEANPIASNKTAQGRALNRRIEIFLGF